MRGRTLSLRAFDQDGLIVTADLVEGQQAEGLIQQLLADRKVDYIQAHFARYGCYAARIERA
jgi:hypothetical protein